MLVLLIMNGLFGLAQHRQINDSPLIIPVSWLNHLLLVMLLCIQVWAMVLLLSAIMILVSVMMLMVHFQLWLIAVK
ncbi:hypothetical protein ABF63_20865 [Enterobacter hormaechei subsp. steigerwaltii]|nr:hypothetical protein ABF63_20865 [Enterobacter hormaechei subsp. steigerwaltii]